MEIEKLQATPLHVPALKSFYQHLNAPKHWDMQPQGYQIGFQNQTVPQLVFFMSFSDFEPDLLELSDYGNVLIALNPSQKHALNDQLAIDNQFNAFYLDAKWGLHFECRAYDQNFDPQSGFQGQPIPLYQNVQKMVNYAAQQYQKLNQNSHLLKY